MFQTMVKSFQKEIRKFAHYKEANGTEAALIHISEVFSYDISLNNDLQMDIHEYRMLCCSVY